MNIQHDKMTYNGVFIVSIPQWIAVDEISTNKLQTVSYQTAKLLQLNGIFLVDDSQTPTKKCPFSEIDFLDVSDDFKQKKIFFLYKKFFGLRKFKKKNRFFCY